MREDKVGAKIATTDDALRIIAVHCIETVTWRGAEGGFTGWYRAVSES
jgi:hypothetical protein